MEKSLQMLRKEITETRWYLKRLVQAERILTGRSFPVQVVATYAVKKRKGGITPAGRKKLSEMMKKRWAVNRRKNIHTLAKAA